MGFTDLFRPKYRHSDASVRAEAVRQLGLEETELLAELARTDSDPSVRRIAIDKLEDPEVLAKLADKESEPTLREHARGRAAQIWTTRAVNAGALAAGKEALAGLVRIGHQRALVDVASRAADMAVREAALAAISDPRALADLARSASAHVTTRTIALARIDDPEVLRSIAVDEQRKDIALAALDRIDDAAVLDAVANKAKSKAVRVRARKKLGEVAPPPEETSSPEDKRRHAERVQLLRRAEQLAQGSEWVESARAMAEIERSWDALGPGDDAEIATRFDKARQRYHARRKGYVDSVTRKEAQKITARGAPARAEASAGPRAQPAAAPANTPAAPAAAAVQDGPAEQVAAAQDGPAEQVAAAAGAQPEGAAGADAPGAAEAAAASDAADGGVPARGATEGPADEARDDGHDGEEARRRREQAEQERQERQARSLATLGQLVQELEATAGASKRKQVERILQKTEKAFGELDLPRGSDEQVQRYHAARQVAVVKVQELREAEDWERWANVPRQEALIARAEALLQAEDDGKLADHLKALQAEWKAVGPVPQKKSRELWERFKSTCDKVYEQVKSARSRVSEEMAVNLQRKEALCEQVEALAESTDWDTTAEEIKRLQREWRDIGPVPRKKSDAVWKRFRAACDRFFERRKPHLEERLAELTENLEKKQALCAQAEALAESSDWKETSLQLRDLQRDWRDVGPVPRKDANAVNKRFRAACDRFFQRRDEHREAERQARVHAVDALRMQIRELLDGQVGPAAAPAEDGGSEAAGEAQASTPGERALRIRAALRELSLSEDQERELHALADQLYRKVLAEEPDAFRGTELDPDANRQRKAKLCARAEALAPASAPRAMPAEAQTPEQMAERLRAALAKNALSSSLARSTDGRNIADTIAELEVSWQRLGPVPGPEGEELEARFQAACERARESAGLESA